VEKPPPLKPGINESRPNAQPAHRPKNHQWELIHKSAEGITTRMRVSNGWIYFVQTVGLFSCPISTVFVPDEQ
jgi:hypothetical protein